MRKALLASVLIAPCFTFASIGTLDTYGCHKDPITRYYHCHGDLDKAKMQHTLVGLNLASDLWTYGDGPSNFFAGGGLSVEFAYNAIGAYGEFSYKPHWSGNPNFSLSDWSAGIKLGRFIARLGTHPYLTAGMFNENLALDDGPIYTLRSYQVGAGVIHNYKKLAFDARVLYRNPAEAQALWEHFNAPGLNQHLAFELGAYIRF
ncbi:MAG: hypothetical protein P8X74_09080 [Reinekea sp.]|jgi:hypothetical protein